MSIEAQCPKCGRGYVLVESMAGSRVRCVACRGIVQLPAHAQTISYEDLAAARERSIARRRRRIACALGGAALIVLTGVIVAAAALPAAARARREAERDLRRRSILRVAAALVAYARAWDDRLPYDEAGPLHSLALLYPEFLPSPGAFAPPRLGADRAPSAKPFPPDTPLRGAPCAYEYFHDVAADPPSAEAVVLREALPGPGGAGRFAIRADGSVVWIGDRGGDR